MTTKTKFIVWAPDYDDPDALQRRLAVRPSHLENALRLASEGNIRFGGAFLSPDPPTNAAAPPSIIGSCMVIEAESLQAVREIVEKDVYYTTGVWDKEKLRILPFMMMTPPS